MAEHEEKHGEGHEEGHGGGSHGGGSHGPAGHGGGEHEESGAPEWLISFADNVALMMGFFVILLAMNMGPKATAVQGGEPGESENGGRAAEDYKTDFAIKIREAFNPIDMNSTNPAEAKFRARKRELEGTKKEDGPEGSAQRAQSVRPTDISNLGGFVLFEDKNTTISSAADSTITAIAKKLRDQRWVVELRGHVSPFESGRSPEVAMALSYERSMQVGRALARLGIPWSQLRVIACGEGDRVVGRSSNHEDDRRNQRVEIMVTKEALPDDAFSKDAK